MSLTPGTHLGPYEILAPLGAGGMGEVYKARDTRLERMVAIKVLAAHLADNPDLKQRFEREAQTISSLNHPHICVLYDIGHQDGIDYLVMEYLEGESLAQRLTKGPLPIHQVLRYSIEIADALDKAHQQGVIHRDLKPGNIMLTKSGAKLLDFGLAKLRGSERHLHTLSSLPTQQASLTVEGTILGTFQYMAPEQLEGKEADAQTDIFGFGAVLYEMATGKKAFEGKTQASLIAAIVDRDPPPISSIQTLSPPALDHVVSRCLAKDPAERWQSAHDLKSELEWIAESGSQAGVPAPVLARRKYRERLAWTSTALFFLLALTLAVVHFGSPDEPILPIRVSVLPPEKTTVGSVTISPDSRYLAFVAFGEGTGQLWVRALDSPAARPLEGTAGATYPFWSPESRFIGFFAGGKLKKIEVSGGPAQELAEAQNARGGTWNRDGVIIFGPNDRGPLYQVAAAGGEAKPVTVIKSSDQELGHRFPQFLPDGRRFIYLSHYLRPEKRKIVVASLDGKEEKILLNNPSQAMYAQPGYMLFLRQGILVAQRFDPDRLEIAGEPVSLAEKVGGSPGFGNSNFYVSENGVLVYGTNVDTLSELVWLDRTGKRLGSVAPPHSYWRPQLSPDEKQVAVERPDPQTGYNDLWVFDLRRGINSRFTFDPSPDYLPIWSPDGNRIVFGSARGDKLGLLQKASSGAGNEEMILTGDNWTYPTDWSQDGQLIVYSQASRQTGWDLWLLPAAGERKPTVFLQTEFNESQARFSPNGRWVVYTSDESGRREIYVRGLRNGGKWQISTAGGHQPAWRADGKELFYIGISGEFMGVDADQNAPTFEFGVPRKLFDTPIRSLNPVFVSGYAVGNDGQRFLVNMPIEQTPFNPIHVILNWAAWLDK